MAMVVLSFFRVVAGAAFVLFVPGYAWSRVFYRKGSIGFVERALYSVAISIALVSVAFFFCNLFLGIPINMLSSTVILVFLTILAPIHILLRKRGVYARLAPQLRRSRKPGP